MRNSKGITWRWILLTVFVLVFALGSGLVCRHGQDESADAPNSVASNTRETRTAMPSAKADRESATIQIVGPSMDGVLPAKSFVDFSGEVEFPNSDVRPLDVIIEFKKGGAAARIALKPAGGNRYTFSDKCGTPAKPGTYTVEVRAFGEFQGQSQADRYLEVKSTREVRVE